MKDESGRDMISGCRALSHEKDPIEFLFRKMQLAKMKENVYFQLQHCWGVDASVHQPMESKLVLDVYNKRKIETICPEKNNMV